MSRVRVVLVCLTLQLGLMAGVPMRPDEIEEMMDGMNQPKAAHTLPSEDDTGDPPEQTPS